MLEDHVLVEMVHSGDEKSLEYLINKYQNLVRGKARKYFWLVLKRRHRPRRNDWLYKAIRDFNEDKLTSFKGFAELCITRQIITAIKTATRQKHGPLNSYISLDKPLYDEESNYTLMDMIPGDQIANPEAVLIHQEKWKTAS